MDQIIQIFLDILGALLQLLSGLVAFATGLVKVPGFIPLLVAALIFYVALKYTKSGLGATLLIVIAGVVVVIIGGFTLFPFLFGGSKAAMRSCYKEAGSDQAALAICQSMGQIPADSQLQSAPVVVVPQGPAPTVAPSVVRQFLKDGLSILSKSWNLFPGSWPSEMQGQLVGPGQVPDGVKVHLVCSNCQILTGKVDERWTMTLSDTAGVGMDPITLTVNGFFARESKGFGANPSGSESVGTGSWDTLCPTCFTDLIITPEPTATPVPTPPGAIINPPPVASQPQARRTCTLDLYGVTGWKVVAQKAAAAGCGVFDRFQLEKWNLGVKPQGMGFTFFTSP